jgi:hypothetical protein
VSESYLPQRLIFSGSRPEVEWIATDGSDYHEPFFEETLRRLSRLPENAGGVRRRTSVDALEATSDAAAPAVFIFHVSRCGSTLVSRLLGALHETVTVSEPPVLDDILRAHGRIPSATDADRIAWLKGAVGALCRPNGTTRRGVVKLDAWHLFELPLVRAAFPDVPFVFVYRQPIEVLVSLMRVPSMAMIRGTVTHKQMRMSVEQRDMLGPVDLAAAILGAYYREAHTHAEQLLPLAYDELPDILWRGMLGATLSDDDVATLKAVAARDAKTPTRPFAADGDAKRRAATPSESAACARWTDDAYAAWTDAVRRGATSARPVLLHAARIPRASSSVSPQP